MKNVNTIKKIEEENQDALKRQVAIAIWYKAKGNMKEALEILDKEIPLDPDYIKTVAKAEKEEVAKMGAILHVVTDMGFPWYLNKQGYGSLCYIEKNGRYSPLPIFCGIK